MSRIGRSPIPVPSGVTVTIDSGNVTVEGARRRAEPRSLPTGITAAPGGLERPSRTP